MHTIKDIHKHVSQEDVLCVELAELHKEVVRILIFHVCLSVVCVHGVSMCTTFIIMGVRVCMCVCGCVCACLCVCVRACVCSG